MKSKIKTFEGACKFLKLDPAKCLPKVTSVPKQHQDAITAHAKIVIITQALNQEANGGKPWKPDWKDDNKRKYYPWFDLSSGSGLSCFDCVGQLSASTVGSRLCFKSRELAEYAGKKFLKEYEAYFLM